MTIKRVACAVSGGVDSAVSAYLLKKKGFDVVGIYMYNWDHVEEGEQHCPRTRDQADAQRICDHLRIPLHTVDFTKEYWNKVFEKFIKGYSEGLTMVADIECNALIKFDALHRHAIQNLGAEAVATGHYAQNSLGNFLELKGRGKPARLLTAVDPIKDQTYFLSRLSSRQLETSMFPLGHLLKPHIKEIAREIGLTQIAEKKESMGLCYVGKKKDFNNFLSKYISQKPGVFIDIESGEILGEHEGIHNFTLGKRVKLPQDYLTHYGFFVTKVEVDTAKVYLCRGSMNPLLYSTKLLLDEPHWICEQPSPEKLQFRCQRTHPTVQCHLEGNELTSKIPIRAPAPGQNCVFYKDNVCYGSAMIREMQNHL